MTPSLPLPLLWQTSDAEIDIEGADESVTDQQTERSMRDRSVAAGAPTSSNLLSKSESEERRRGIIRSDVSNGETLSSLYEEVIGLVDAPVAQPPVVGASVVPFAKPGAIIAPGCPICRVHFPLVFAEMRQQHEYGDGNTKLSHGKSTGRKTKAVSALVDNLAGRYQQIFELAERLNGLCSDEQLIGIMLEVHFELIERTLTYQGIQFTPWTKEALNIHFNPANEHIFDPVREVKEDLRTTRRAINIVSLDFTKPDAKNPGRRVVDIARVRLFQAMSGHRVGLLKDMTALKSSRGDNVSGAMFALSTAIGRRGEAGADEMMSDPNMAAGTLVAGGDVARSAITDGRSQAHTIYRSGY